MQHTSFLILATAILSFFAGPIIAGAEAPVSEEHKMVVQIKGDDFEIHQTDISDLEVGDAETIYTESGKRIDLLRSKDGVEVYIDGELLDTGAHGEMAPHADHRVVHKHVEVICDQEVDCDEHVWISEDMDVDMEAMHEAHGEKVIVVKKVVQVTED